MAASRNVVIFDGECWFCMVWLRRIRRWVGGSHAIFRPFQAAHGDYPSIGRERFERALYWIGADGRVFSGAEAVFMLATGGDRLNHPWAVQAAETLLGTYRRVPAFRRVTDATYRFVADHRPLVSRFTRWIFGESTRKPTFEAGRFLFEKGLFLSFAIAFASLLPQVRGLIGEQGILPIGEWLEPAAARLGGALGGFLQLPSLFWFVPAHSIDAGLAALGVLGFVSALLGLAGAPGLSTTALLSTAWVSYASLVNAGRVFLAYQWDALLLELGFWGIVLLLGSRSRRSDGRAMALAVGAVLFKLLFLSGWAKLASGDPSWRDLSATAFHFHTQPLPNPLSPFLHDLPPGLHRVLGASVLAVEWLAPFFLFFPRRLRFWGISAMAALQLLIFASGNYGYFNLLVLGASLALVDDLTWREVLPRRWIARFLRRPRLPRASEEGGWKRLFPALALPIILFPMALVLSGADPSREGWAGRLDSLLARWRISQDYGLFAVMTTRREEIFFEVSEDERNWTELRFKAKPQDVSRLPAQVAPHLPRLDWQLWFASFGSYDQPANRWVASFMSRVLEGRPEVLDLLDVPLDSSLRTNPPRYIRARIAAYEFSEPAERRGTGLVWRRGAPREWSPVLSRMPRP